MVKKSLCQAQKCILIVHLFIILLYACAFITMGFWNMMGQLYFGNIIYRFSFLIIWVALRRAIWGNGLRFIPFTRIQTYSPSQNQIQF